MAPKRRPAAALPPREGRPGRRRPAAAVEEAVEVKRSAEELFAAGESIEANKVPLGCLQEGLEVIVTGAYWGLTCMVSGKILGLAVKAQKDIELRLRAEGTDNEDLLTWVSQNREEGVRVHLCGDSCTRNIEAHGFLHASFLKKKMESDRGGWTENLREEVDELSRLRALAAERDEKAKEKEKKEKREEKGESSSSTDAKKSKKKKKKESGTKEREKKKKKKKKEESKKWKISPQKELEACFKDTGLDPDPRIRSKGNLWSKEQKEVPAVCLQYFRNNLQRKLAGGALREGLTICWSLDLLLRGRISEAADSLSQRLKALEMIGSGASWGVAQRVELTPPEKGLLSTRAETNLAAKENLAEAKVRQQAKGKERPKGESGGGTPWKGYQKGDGKNKGKSKKGDKEEGKKDLKGHDFSSAMPLIESLLISCCKTLNFEVRGKAKPTGNVFPLPTSIDSLEGIVGQDVALLGVLRCLCMALNNYAGEALEGPAQVNKLHKELLQGLFEDVKVTLSWGHVFNDVSWNSFFRSRGVDYAGDEVATAKYTSWDNLKSAIPAQVGTVELCDLLDGGCLHYVENFTDYLLDETSRVFTKAPRVMVYDDSWDAVCEGLIASGICRVISEDDLFKVSGQPLLNGLFGVEKGELDGQFESHRLIMNLIPLNNICRGIQGDVATLPSWASMGPMTLMPTEQLLISSEDVRCFFYIFKVPESWHPFLGFNKVVPSRFTNGKPGKHYLCATVLPMGFKNSVSLAQAVHRSVVAKASQRVSEGLSGDQELRKDRPFPRSNFMYRVYLDNYDELEKCDSHLAGLIRGEPSSTILALRAEYEHWGIPRHPKKAVQRLDKAEVQGAIVNGMQVIAGGLVYISTFRRAVLGSLNHVWQFIEKFNDHPPVVKLEIPALVKLEIARCIAMLPLAKLSFRQRIETSVTASDASTTGGGLTVSTGLTNLGQVASTCKVRGDLPEASSIVQVLTIGLFDGIGALRVASDSLQLPIAGHISVEKDPCASRVLESRFPGTVFVSDIELVDAAMTKDWACQFSQVGLVLIGAGPPCQGVSGLNANRRGALRDSRSCLFVHIPRIKRLVQAAFPWAQVHLLGESVQSMDETDRTTMSTEFELVPWAINAGGVSLAQRPRLYWVSWELCPQDGVTITAPSSSAFSSFGTIDLEATILPEQFLEAGWSLKGASRLPTFTTSRPRAAPGRSPAGLNRLSSSEIQQWEEDLFRFPPYQYQLCYQLHKGDQHRLPSPEEREVIMGFPKGYTMHCLPKAQQHSQQHVDTRCTLIGNSWNVTVVAWLISQLAAPLGLCRPHTPADCVQVTSPGSSRHLAAFLVRPPMNSRQVTNRSGNEYCLIRALMNQVSIKGEDILLSAATEDTLKFHRLRASIPSNLWRWRTVCGWQWRGHKDHINVLEMRAVLCGLRWRIAKQGLRNAKFCHLVDSLVCLHSLSRGRTSSRKMRRTLCKINSLLLASRNHGVWTYVHTSSNPADRPSRRGVRRKWARK
eukprot:Skav209942  [mRNA]  locus=scaffold102:393196:398480:+ [translate_table: standard]